MAGVEVENDESFIARPPAHPVAQLQGPFEESMVESVNDITDHETSMDSVARRTMLLEMPKYERVIAGRWKQKPGEKYHPLWKITAQMSFGMHLLAEGMARSEEEVMKILQSHVDDVDGFLERTTEDFDLAQSDIQERLRYLKLPLEHADVFDRMLEDRTFRMSIVEGNEKIEHIVERTSEAMKDSMKDVQKGLDASKALDKYLTDLDRTWIRNTVEHEAVFVAMVGNVEGWSRAFMDLHMQGNKLGKFLVQLSEIVGEMQKRAGFVSRRMLIRPESNIQNAHHSHQSTQPHYIHRNGSRPNSSRTSWQYAISKQLPVEPEGRSSRSKAGRGSLPRQSPSTEKQAILHGNVVSGMGLRRQDQTRTPSMHGSLKSPASSSASTPGAKQTFISELAANEARVPEKQVSPKQRARTKDIPPTELPADVPPKTTPQALHSRQSLLSSTTGLEHKKRPPHKTSSVISSKRLSSLLKSPLPSRVSIASQHGASGNTSSSSVPDILQIGSVGDYFGTKPVQAPDITCTDVLRPHIYRGSGGLGIHGVSGLASTGGTISQSHRRKLTAENPTFTSHPPNDMFSKPPLPGQGSVKPAELPSEAHRTHDVQRGTEQKIPDPSSLGHQLEWNTAPGGLKTATGPLAVSSQGTSLLNAIAKRSLLATSKSPANIAIESPGESGQAEAVEPTSNNTLVAEMEGSSPVLLAPLTFGPAELEAPQERLVLPPRPATSGRGDKHETDELTARIASQDDFFKLPALQHADPLDVLIKPTTGKLVPKHTSMPTPTVTQRGVGTGDGRNSLPPQLMGSAFPRKEAPGRLRLRSALMDQLSYTPPESPIHSRAVSETSASSARLDIERPSRSLAPPKECPPPPAPGGRPMVTPDYASAGAFEGERRSKHNSNGSLGSWKKLFSPGAAQLSPTGSKPDSIAHPRPESSAKTAGVDMMTAGGKDILWFKGMSRDGVWVAST